MNSRLSAGIGIAPDSGAATDLNRLHQMKVGKNRDSDANVHKVAQEFESLFLNEMLKAMRSANAVFAEGNFMNSNESKTYQDMQPAVGHQHVQAKRRGPGRCAGAPAVENLAWRRQQSAQPLCPGGRQQRRHGCHTGSG